LRSEEVVVALTAATVTPDPLTRNGRYAQSPGRKIIAELADVFEPVMFKVMFTKLVVGAEA